MKKKIVWTLIHLQSSMLSSQKNVIMQASQPTFLRLHTSGKKQKEYERSFLIITFNLNEPINHPLMNSRKEMLKIRMKKYDIREDYSCYLLFKVESINIRTTLCV